MPKSCQERCYAQYKIWVTARWSGFLAGDCGFLWHPRGICAGHAGDEKNLSGLFLISPIKADGKSRPGQGALPLKLYGI